MSERREPGPRSREIVAREARHIAPGYQSFALYRDEAAPVIASYLALRFGARRASGGGR